MPVNIRLNPIKIPQNLQAVLWSTDVKLLDKEKHKGYIIHQVLMYGTFSDIRWLLRTYSKKEIVSVFREHPYKNYPKDIFYFVKNYILGLKDLKLDEQEYITSISGPVRSRAANNL